MSADEVERAAGPCPRTRRVVHYGHASDARCMARSCPSCGVLWLGDTRIRTLAAALELRAAVALVTVTAPGRHVLPWDSTGKRVDEAEARRWNEAAPERWSSLHRRAAKRARAKARKLGITWRLTMKTWEYQKRGVLHLHLIVPCGNGAERQVSEAYVSALVDFGPSEGFGFVDRGKLPRRGARVSARELSPVAPHRAAAYLASYVASSGAGKEGIAEVARKQGVPGAIVYIAQSLTQLSGVTMQSLRARRRLVCAFPEALASRDHWDAAAVVDGLRRSRAPFHPDLRGELHAQAVRERWGGGIDAATGELLPPTRAALPPAVSEMFGPRRGPRCRVVTRLDSVTHGGPEADGHVQIWTDCGVVSPR